MKLLLKTVLYLYCCIFNNQKPNTLTQEEIRTKLKEIVQPYIPEPESVGEINEDTDFLEDLQINSAHLIDIILDVEDAFDIEISDEEAEEMLTVEKTVGVIEGKVK